MGLCLQQALQRGGSAVNADCPTALQAARPFRAGYLPGLSGAGEAGLGWASAGLSFGSQP